jgi:hypothetical protein
MKKYRFERKGRRNFDTALHYNTMDMIATEKTRTAKSAVRATRFYVCIQSPPCECFQSLGSPKRAKLF